MPLGFRHCLLLVSKEFETPGVSGFPVNTCFLPLPLYMKHRTQIEEDCSSYTGEITNEMNVYKQEKWNISTGLTSSTW